jgi:hypothetical protein
MELPFLELWARQAQSGDAQVHQRPVQQDGLPP